MSDIVQKLWGFCHTLRHDGIDYGDYIEQITYLLFLKMSDERALHLPEQTDWAYLRTQSGTDLTDAYTEALRLLGRQPGILGDIFSGAQSRFTNPVDFKIGDPACGTGGFLVAAYEWLIHETGGALDRDIAKRIRTDTYYGRELVARPRRLALMNLYLHQVEPHVSLGDSIYEVPGSERFDVILTNLLSGLGAPTRLQSETTSSCPQATSSSTSSST